MNIAIIPAAGSGSRIGGEVPKQFIEIAGAPILIHTIRRFDACPEIDCICVALSPEGSAFSSRIGEFGLSKNVMFVSGGNERSDSIKNALDAIAGLSPEIVAIHDAVRPFVTPELISSVVTQAKLRGAAIAAQRAADTIKEAEAGIVVRTLDRRRIFRAQTPQAFRYDLICRANDEARQAGIGSDLLTDDAMLVERLGVGVSIVEGPASNFKITTPEDLAFARFLLESERLR
jgi:2-C-methyl-D-erythritol 4-phosphate cytidylyltransferase